MESAYRLHFVSKYTLSLLVGFRGAIYIFRWLHKKENRKVPIDCTLYQNLPLSFLVAFREAVYIFMDFSHERKMTLG